VTGPPVPTPDGPCPGCGSTAVLADGPRPALLSASSGCWAQYCEVLSRSYGDPEYRRVHQVVVDAYGAQHPAGRGRREAQAVALHLMTLCLIVEDGADPAHGPALHKQMMARRPPFTSLSPPSLAGLTTAADVLKAGSADEHRRMAYEWGSEVWQAWRPHHATVRAWNAHALGSP